MRWTDLSLRRCASAAAFTVPALALTVPSGYSYGAAWLLLCSLVFLPRWLRQPLPDRRVWWLVVSFLLMAAVWQADTVLSGEGWRGADKPVKYLLAVPCLLFLVRFPPRVRYLWAGICAGAIGAGLVSLYQRFVLHEMRPDGFANAIQSGNLSLLLGIMCVIAFFTARQDKVRAGRYSGFALAAGALLGTIGSLLSQSRGGWFSLGIVVPVLLVVLGRFVRYRYLIGAAVLMLLCGTLIIGVSGRLLGDRIAKMRSEVVQYEEKGDAESSVGQRLAHWKAAWAMGLKKPVFGWTTKGYAAEKQRMVDAGEAHPYILQFNHAHNEFLDALAKRGSVGVAVLLLLYAVPVVIFWPRQKWEKFRVSHFRSSRMAARQPALPPELGLQLIGLSLPVAYFGFGLSQVFLGHNSGTMFYLFMVSLIYSCVHAIAREQQTA
jgi:O-antigen ligase